MQWRETWDILGICWGRVSGFRCYVNWFRSGRDGWEFLGISWRESARKKEVSRSKNEFYLHNEIADLQEMLRYIRNWGELARTLEGVARERGRREKSYRQERGGWQDLDDGIYLAPALQIPPSSVAPIFRWPGSWHTRSGSSRNSARGVEMKEQVGVHRYYLYSWHSCLFR